MKISHLIILSTFAIILLTAGCSDKNEVKIDQQPKTTNFCPNNEDCNDMGIESRKCVSQGECGPTCAYGCVTKKWMEGRIDCLKVVDYKCECIDNSCQII